MNNKNYKQEKTMTDIEENGEPTVKIINVNDMDGLKEWTDTIDLKTYEEWDIPLTCDKGNVLTALSFRLSNPNVVEFLVKNGCDVNYTSKMLGLTPLLIASLSSADNRKEIMDTLVRLGADTSCLTLQYKIEHPRIFEFEQGCRNFANGVIY